MKEQYISLETAKLAKEKKVHIEGCCEVYSQEGGAARTPNGGKWNWEEYDKSEFCLRPTQSLLARYLREKYNTHVISRPVYSRDNTEQYGCDIHYPDKHGLVFTIISHVLPVFKQISNHKMTKELGTYEDAMETDLQEALKLI